MGYSRSPHDANYKDGCNDGINGVPTVNPSNQALFMAKLKQWETQNNLYADVNPSYAYFPNLANKNNPGGNGGDEDPSQNSLHNVFPTRRKSTLLNRTPLPLLIK